ALRAKTQKEEGQEGTAKNGDQKAWRQGVAAAESKSGGAQPVEQRRLLKPGFAKKTRRNPIATLPHGAPNIGITRFIGAEKASFRKSMEIQHPGCNSDSKPQENPRKHPLPSISAKASETAVRDDSREQAYITRIVPAKAQLQVMLRVARNAAGGVSSN